MAPTLGLALLALLIAALQAPLYRAEGSLEIQGAPESFLDIQSASVTAIYVQNQAQLIRSYELLDRARERVISDFSGVTLERRSAIPIEPPPTMAAFLTPPPTVEEAAGLAASMVEIGVSNDNTILDVRTQSSDPEIAASFVNHLLSEYIAWTREQRWKSYRDSGEWLLQVQEKLRDELTDSEERLRQYANQNGIVLTSEDLSSQDSNVETLKLKQLQAELSSAQADRILKQASLSIISSGWPDYVVANDANSPVAQHRAKLADLQRERAELLASLTPAHYRVQRVEAQIEAVTKTLEKERAAASRQIRAEYESARNRETLLTEEYSKQSRQVSAQSDQLIQYGILKREVDINRKLYEATMQKGEEASISSALRAANGRIVNSAYPQSSPSLPFPPLYAGIGAIAGLSMGIGFVLIRDRADHSLRQPGDAVQHLCVPELGVVPSVRKEPWRPAIQAGERGSKWPITLRDAEGPGAPDIENCSFMSDCCRSIVTSILFSTQRSAPRTIIITSPAPREGKSWVSANLASMLREVKPRVLLIDGDMRRHQLDAIFGTPSSPGLSDLLRSQKPISEYSDDIFRKTGLSGLFLLPAGSPSEGLSTLLYSSRMKDLMARFRQEFDLILIDTPPTLHIPDARILSLLADAVVLVIRAGQTTRQAAQAAIDKLDADGAPLLGVVLNDWNPNQSGYGVYSGEYQRYYSNDSESSSVS